MIRLYVDNSNEKLYADISAPKPNASVEEAAKSIFMAIQFLSEHYNLLGPRLFTPAHKLSELEGMVGWGIMWVGGPCGWAESFCLNPESQGQFFMTFPATLFTLGVVGKN